MDQGMRHAIYVPAENFCIINVKCIHVDNFCNFLVLCRTIQMKPTVSSSSTSIILTLLHFCTGFRVEAMHNFFMHTVQC